MIKAKLQPVPSPKGGPVQSGPPGPPPEVSRERLATGTTSIALEPGAPKGPLVLETPAAPQFTPVVGHAVPTIEAVESPQARLARMTADIQTLVRIPSQGGIDDPSAISAAVIELLERAGMKAQLLRDENGRAAGVVSEVVGGRPGPRYVLDAVVDSAPVGSTAAWSRPPFGAELSGSKMYGRGTADSKAAAVIFIEVAKSLLSRQAEMAGSTVLFFDAAEHTGEFQGVKALLDQYAHIDGVLIGYPGDTELNVGSRGFYRSQLNGQLVQAGNPRSLAQVLAAPVQVPLPTRSTEAFPLPPKLSVTAVASQSAGASTLPGPMVEFELRITGVGAHSGSSRNGGVNAVAKTAAFLEAMGPGFEDAVVTGLNGGFGFSVIPDEVVLKLAFPREGLDVVAKQTALNRLLAGADAALPGAAASQLIGSQERDTVVPVAGLTANIDVRTTEAFGDADARAHLQAELSQLNRQSGVRASLTEKEAWQAFVLDRSNPMRVAVERAAEASGAALTSRVSGPSNVGNLLASKGIPATTGYGVATSGGHVPNEWIDVDSIPRVLATYEAAVAKLMGLEDRPS